MTCFSSSRSLARHRWRRLPFPLFAEPPLPPQAVQSLLRGALSRAKRTLSEKDEAALLQEEPETNSDASSSSSSAELLSLFDGLNNPSASPSDRTVVANDLLGGITNRTKRTLQTSTKSEVVDAEVIVTPPTTKKSKTKTPPSKKHKVTPTDLRYNQNPAVSLTALAQFMWASVLRPHEDTAIDATCGNGYDAAGIASILMGNEDLYLYQNSELICIDIQKQACQATEERLSEILNPSTLRDRVRILPTSHAPSLFPKIRPRLD